MKRNKSGRTYLELCDPWRDTPPTLDPEVQDFADKFMRGEITVKRNLGDPRRVMYDKGKVVKRSQARKGAGITVRGKSRYR